MRNNKTVVYTRSADLNEFLKQSQTAWRMALYPTKKALFFVFSLYYY